MYCCAFHCWVTLVITHSVVNKCGFKCLQYRTNFDLPDLLEEFDDTKGVIRIRKSKTDRQHNGQKTDNTMVKRQTTQWPKEKKDQRTNNDLQNITNKDKDRVTRTPPKTGGELRCSGRVSSFCSTSGTRRVTQYIYMRPLTGYQ